MVSGAFLFEENQDETCKGWDKGGGCEFIFF